MTSSRNKIISVTITFADNQLSCYTGESGRYFNFYFDPSKYKNGLYNLHINILTKTGSGSIAEKTDAEGYQYEYDWPVIIDNTLPLSASDAGLTAVKTSKGIELNWTAFKHLNFRTYEIMRQYPGIEQESLPIAVINKSEITTFTDSTYWQGQQGVYTLRIATPAGSYDMTPLTYTDHLTGLKAAWNGDGSVNFTWDAGINILSFGKYHASAAYFSSAAEEYYIDDPAQNFITFKNTGIGYGLLLSLSIIPKDLPEEKYGLLDKETITLYPSSKCPAFLRSANVNNHNFLLLTGIEKIYRYSPSSQLAEDSIPCSWYYDCSLKVSSDGDKFVYYQDGQLHIRKTTDFSPVRDINVSGLTAPISGCSLSDNNILLAVDCFNWVYLFNIENGQLIRKDSIPLNGYYEKNIALSPDGISMTAQTDYETISLYNLGVDGWVEAGKTSVTNPSFIYSKDGSSIYLANYNKIQIRRSDNFQIITQYSVPEGNVLSADMDNLRVLIAWDYLPSTIYIFDLKTGRILCVIPGQVAACSLIDNYLIASGIRYILPQFQ